jgi:hypothetical protein
MENREHEARRYGSKRERGRVGKVMRDDDVKKSPINDKLS